MKPGIYGHRHSTSYIVAQEQHFPKDSDLIEALKASEGHVHPVAMEGLMELSNSLICAAVRRCYDDGSRCYYINGIYMTYIRLWMKARDKAPPHMQSSLSNYYGPGDIDCADRFVNLVNGYRLSRSQGEDLLVNSRTGLTCRLVNDVEREIAQFVTAIRGATTACYRLSDLSGQYLHMLLESDCYCRYSEDGPTFDTAPGCLEIV